MPKQQDMAEATEKQFIGDGFKVESIDGEERTVTAVISTDAIDRDSEVLLPKGADIEQFQKNPVVLWSHNSSLPPIGKALWIERKGKKIIAKVQFATTELAEEVWQLFKGGFLKAFSVGFIPIESRSPTPDDIRKKPEWAEVRRIFSKWLMLEASAVGVPSNPEALATAIKEGKFECVAKDFNIEIEEEIKEIEEEVEQEDKEIEQEIINVEIAPVSCKRIIPCTKCKIISVSAVIAEGVKEAVKLKKGIVYLVREQLADLPGEIVAERWSN